MSSEYDHVAVSWRSLYRVKPISARTGPFSRDHRGPLAVQRRLCDSASSSAAFGAGGLASDIASRDHRDRGADPHSSARQATARRELGAR